MRAAEHSEIRTTTVGSYPVPDWLASCPSEQASADAIRVVVDTQRQFGIDLPTDGELYRFDINHPDTNGMIEYFINPLDGVRTSVGWNDWQAFAEKNEMSFRAKPAGVIEGPIGEGSLNLVAACNRSVHVVGAKLKFTITSPYMLARTLLDRHYGDIEAVVTAIAKVLSAQTAELVCDCVQIDEANIPGNPDDWPIASKGINMLLNSVKGEKAVHFCFGNYGGQTIQTGNWDKLIAFLNSLACDHLVLEIAHRPEDDLYALKEVDKRIGLGIGVIDIKVNHIETPDEIAARIENAEKVLGPGRVRWIHPDCGFWMLKRSIVDRKIAAIAKGRDLYLGYSSEER